MEINNPILLTVFGAILGHILPYVFRFICALFKKNRALILGNYSGFYCDNEIIIPMTLKIEKRIFYKYYDKFAKYHVTFQDPKFHYEGNGYIENNLLCVDMKNDDKDLKDSVHHRYDLTGLQEKEFCYGLWLAIGFDGKLSCGGLIISKNEVNKNKMNEDEAKKLISDKYHFYKDKPFISLK